MEHDGALIGEVGEVVDVTGVDDGVPRRAAVGGRDVDALDRVGDVVGCVLLEEALAVDPVREPLEHERPPRHERQQVRRDAAVVVDDLGLGDVVVSCPARRCIGRREEHLVGVRDVGGPGTHGAARGISRTTSAASLSSRRPR